MKINWQRIAVTYPRRHLLWQEMKKAIHSQDPDPTDRPIEGQGGLNRAKDPGVERMSIMPPVVQLYQHQKAAIKWIT